MNFLIFILIVIALIYRYGYEHNALSAQILDTGLIGLFIAIGLYNVVFRPLIVRSESWAANIILGILLLAMPVLIAVVVLWIFLSGYPVPPG